MADKKQSESETIKVAKFDDSDAEGKMDYWWNSPAYMNSALRRTLLHEMVKSLPVNIQKRINALRNAELERLNLESQFYEEVYKLERKYHDLYQPLHDRRKDIVVGNVEPSGKETEWTSKEDEDAGPDVQSVTQELRKNLKLNYQDDVKGIPDFWFTIFRNTELLSSMVQSQDEPAIKKLTDIKIVYHEEPMSYTLEFYFEPNEFFSNSVLTKTYFLKLKIEEDDPFAFEGPEIYKCVGCNIDWKEKNLTVKTIKQKQKHKARSAVRTITKQVPVDSFFNFFNPPKVQDDNKSDIDNQAILSTDFEIGHFLRARIIPKAVLYYTGDIVDDDDDYDEEEEEEEEDEEEDESDDNEDEDDDKGKGRNKKKQSPAKAIKSVGAAPECKQQ